MSLQMFQHCIAVHFGHLHVQQHQVKGLALEFVQRLSPVFAKPGLVAEFGNVTGEHDAVHAVVVHDQERAGGSGWRLIGCDCLPLHPGHFMPATSQFLQLRRCEHQYDDGAEDGMKKTRTGDCSTEDDGI